MNKNYEQPQKENLAQIAHGTISGSYKIASEIFKGFLALYELTLTYPTAKRQYSENSNNYKNRSNLDFFNKIPRTELIGFTANALALGMYSNKIYDFIKENPAYLLVPLVTNLLSAGYERYRREKTERQSGLEEIVERPVE